jgi:hypothetical protein
LVFTWRGTAHKEGDTTFFRIKISWRGRTTGAVLDDLRRATSADPTTVVLGQISLRKKL